MSEIPAVIKTNLPDEAAEIYVIETNLIQRGFSDLKISEQAFAVAMRYSKMFDERKLKGIDEELYLIENGKKKPTEEELSEDQSKHRSTRDMTAEEYGISQTMVARLLRINKLTDDFKELVDNGSIKVRPAVDISFLSENQQKMLYSLMKEMDVNVINTKMAKQLRDISNSYAQVSEEFFAAVLTGEYGTEDKKDKGEKITLPSATYKRYLSKYSRSEANAIIEKALELYFEQNEKTI